MFQIPKPMQAVVYRGANDLRLETLPVPRIINPRFQLDKADTAIQHSGTFCDQRFVSFEQNSLAKWT